MGLFDEVSKMVEGEVEQRAGVAGGASALPSAVVEMLANRGGGVGGLVQDFEQNGLGNIVQSWIGSGANHAISPEQIQQVLGDSRIAALAEKVGISPDQVSSQLSSILPGLVDKLTPNGNAAESEGLLRQGIGALEGLFERS